ncbi:MULTISPECIES: nutrient deprivation-induced protein [unclassified Rhizobium]|uniref:nutrient deprivation-induced protein n=1 Tax=unclassified Rhizobium TaxID=2613769 RepID=UPI000AEB3279|nr:MULTISPECIES: nutrient deprivation-induced protein [unclassified Rhizobium]
MPDDHFRSNERPASMMPMSGNRPAASSATQEPSPALSDKVKEDVGAAQETLKIATSNAAEQTKGAASGQVNFAVRQVQGIARAFEKAGAELEGSDQAEVGRYTKQIGQSVDRFAKKMEGKDIGEIATIAEGFGRQQPLAFLGMAAIAGLAASRFLTASANRTTAGSITPSETSREHATTGGAKNV